MLFVSSIAIVGDKAQSVHSVESRLCSLFAFLIILQYSSEEEEVDLQTALTGYQTKHRKLLEPVDHGKIEYESYRKNFYVEVPELAKMNQEGKINLGIDNTKCSWNGLFHL